MDVNQWLRAVAGVLILISLGLGHFVSPYWFLFTAFIGVNLFQSAFTKWCPMMSILRGLGAKG
jgi:hypothetical protein